MIQGCSIIFVDDQDRILLSLRDDTHRIPYPNMWDLPGGHVEDDETPAECIVREMKEEMGLDIGEIQLFSVEEFADRTEFTFWKKIDLDTSKIELSEGQRVQLFTYDEIDNMMLFPGFKKIIRKFFREAPYKCRENHSG
jgi:8-oxo-dGTP diphosphatase